MEATQQAEDGGQAAVNPANVHFFRPNDGIYVSEGPEQRTICVSPHLPAAMARTGDWHVEQFELHKELYRGKTSLLYMATDRISGVQVALKLYRKRKLSILNRYQVEREVRLHINLHHENIIHLYAAFEDEKHVYMVQEFAVCGDLFEDLKKGGGQMKEKYAVRDVIVPFLSALAYLHNQGIIHRDIKPENILLGANKVVKVADFGLSINIHHERPVTRAGTLDYMAPEVLVCPDKRRPDENKDKVLLGYTAQVDSWAVGILAYELLVGYPPFEQESRAATYEHIMYKEPKFPSWMSEEAKRFIGLALCKNATQRPTVADLMAHSWVAPYMMRHMLPAGANSSSSSPGPSRLRNSVSSHHREAPGGGARDTHGTQSSSVNGMVPAPPASSSSGMTGQGQGGGMGPGVGGRMFMPVSPPPAAAAGAAAGHQIENGGYTPDRSQHAPAHSSSSIGTHRSAPVPPAQPQLKTATSMHAHVATHGSLEPLSGAGSVVVSGSEGGRLHDSISDPTARTYELQNPHPPGAAASASLFGGGGSRSGGGATLEVERVASITSTASGGGGSVGTAVRPSQAVTSGVPSHGGSLSLTARLGSPHPSGAASGTSTRVAPPPLTLLDCAADGTSDHSMGAVSSGDYTPISPCGPPSRPSSSLASRLAPQMSGGAVGAAALGGSGVTSASTVRHRMASMAAPVVPPVNLAGAAAAGAGGMRMPAPPLSPKPSTPDLAPGFHRPASGVLSDDSFLPPARTPSMSLGSQLLSPLQAQLMAPRPSSRLNSPSHSRRNSVSQAGQQPSTSTHGYHHPQHYMNFQHTSTPLPQLSNDYNEGDDLRTSASYRSGAGANGAAGAPAAAPGSKAFGKFWGRDPAPPPGGPGSGCCGDPNMEGATTQSSFSSRSGGGGIGTGGAGSPIIRSVGGAAGAAGAGTGGPRVRMMTPPSEGMRPLMRESSITSSFKSSGGGSLRDELTQQSMTMYHRPGKVPGVGRAALAAREAEAAEAAAGAGAGALTSGGSHGAAGGLGKAKSLVNRNLNGVLADDGPPVARLGSEVALARTAAGAVAAAAAAGGHSGPHGVASQRSFTSANSAFARKLANGAIATKVTEYVKGRLPHDEDMDD